MQVCVTQKKKKIMYDFVENHEKLIYLFVY